MLLIFCRLKGNTKSFLTIKEGIAIDIFNKIRNENRYKAVNVSGIFRIKYGNKNQY